MTHKQLTSTGRAILALTLLTASGAQAASSEDDLFFGELPIVASVSRLPQRISETPAAVTVIDQEMIRASGFRTVEDLLRLVPGFQVTSHSQDPAIISYHGLNTGMNSDEYGPRVQVLIDGRSQYSPLFKSGVNWNLLPIALENIDRIEVTRGSNTVSYGSNAFMGVVNIITLDASQTRGWMVSANHGNNGIRDQTLRWGGRVDDTDIRFTAKEFNDDGFQKGYYSGVWMSNPDSRLSRLFDLRADMALTNRDELQLTLSHATDTSRYGRPGSEYDMQQRSTSLGLQWRRIVAANEEVKLRYAYSEDWASALFLERISFDTNLSDPKSVVFYNSFDPGGKSATHELEFEHILAPMDKMRMIWGASAKTIALNSYAQFSSNGTRSRDFYRTFANLEFHPDSQWLFNLGASLEHDSLTGLSFDPRASVSYHLTPTQTFRLIATRAHRTPSLYDASGRVEKRDVSGTSLADIAYLGQGVDPERVDSVEIGYLGEFKSARASIDVRAFLERIPNRIQIVPLALPAGDPDDRDSLVGRYHPLANTIFPYGRADSAINLERVMIRGYEYQARWQPFDGTRLIYSNAVIGIDAYLTDESVIADTADINTTKISRQTRASAPTHSQSAMLIQKLPYDIQASVMYYRNKPMRWRRNSDPLQTSERFDWRLAKPFKIGTTRAEVAYTVQMANGSQEGRQIFRIADKLQWISLHLSF